MYYAFMPAPQGIGRRYVQLTASDAGITGLDFVDEVTAASDAHPHLQRAQRELEAYFAGELKQFSVPLVWQGTAFQNRVWQTLVTIPYGEVWSYRQLAEKVQSAKHCRAVGLANGRNPISILVPCHRVIGSNGQLTGYSGGLDIKRWLLDHEHSYC